MIKGIVRSASQLSYVNSDKSDTRIFVQEADLKTYKKESRSMSPRVHQPAFLYLKSSSVILTPAPA